jgi:hypothetical protein
LPEAGLDVSALEADEWAKAKRPIGGGRALRRLLGNLGTWRGRTLRCLCGYTLALLF